MMYEQCMLRDLDDCSQAMCSGGGDGDRQPSVEILNSESL